MVSGTQYITNINEWTYTCGQQKYNTHHLCKHLVQAVAHPPTNFWHEVIHCCTVPIYQHPALVPKLDDSRHSSPIPIGYLDPKHGSITDGDDHIWSGDKAILKGGGGWHNKLVDHTSAVEYVRSDDDDRVSC